MKLRYRVGEPGISTVVWICSHRSSGIVQRSRREGVVTSPSGVTGWTPPFVPDLPAPVNTVLSVAGVVAAVDRGLRRRYHPLLDG